jgi:3-hydroxymyristoyl/3-hydroxydecanoyl-(acyl carrier protein) dehydratase
MGFLFVDRITQMERGKRATGIKQVTQDDPFFYVPEGGKPELSTAIIGEALGQLAAWVAMDYHDFAYRAVGGSLSEIQVHGSAHVGDTVVLDAELDSLDDRIMVYRGTASVEGKIIFSVKKVLAPILPMDLFIDAEEARQQFKKIHRLGELPTYSSSHSFGDKSSAGVSNSRHCYYDQLLELSAEGLTAKKNLTGTAFYFKDHFPKNPVFPFSLLLDCYVNVSNYFLRKQLGLKGSVRLSRIRKAKINNFIQPGDSFITKVHYKGKRDEGYVFAFQTEVDGKKTSTAEEILFS